MKLIRQVALSFVFLALSGFGTAQGQVVSIVTTSPGSFGNSSHSDGQGDGRKAGLRRW
jgi:hypothetical protein